MRTRRQIGKGFNAWRGKSRHSFKYCVNNEDKIEAEVADYLSGLFDRKTFNALVLIFNDKEKNSDKIETLLRYYEDKVYNTRRFRSFFTRCVFQYSLEFESKFNVTKTIMQDALRLKQKKLLKINEQNKINGKSSNWLVRIKF